MSLILETYCEDYEDLFEEIPSLRKNQVMAGSDTIYLLLFPHEFSDYYGDDLPNFVEYLEEQFGLKDPIFTNLKEEDETAVAAEDAILYLSRVLEILKEHKDDLPLLYSFRDDATGEAYLETAVGNTKLQGGYDHCIAVVGDTVGDIRKRDSYDANGERFSIVRESIADVFGEEFAAMLEVAKTARRFNRHFVATVY